ncbi:MAG: DNRLRE domain-containing protein [Bacteroidota bacterium]
MQCRSLLAFDYGILPKLLKPEQIVEAQLILRPVEFSTVESINGVPSPKFSIQRIVEPWEDSLINWLTQPASEVTDETVKQLDVTRKRKTIKIDVTEIVKNMFRFGNNGFMIRNEDSLETAVFISQWFASAKNEDEKLRPQLVIKWSRPVATFDYENDRSFVDMALNGWRRNQIPYQQPMGQPYNAQEPVPAPVIPNDNPPQPPKTPVKD